MRLSPHGTRDALRSRRGFGGRGRREPAGHRRAVELLRPERASCGVMGCDADRGTQRSAFPQGNPVGAGRLSAEGRDYLSRLAACAPRPDAGPPTGSPADAVRDCLAEQVRRVGPVAFVVQHPLARPRAAGCAIWQSVPERWGCSIRVYDPADASGAARTLFEDPDGAIFDMSLSRDAATLFFAHRARTEDCWQLWEIGVDGRGLKRISRDSAHHDVSPVELPDGDLLFVSTRAGGYLVSEPGPRSNLWRMRRDGSGARCVSQNTLADFSPRLMFDGRVLFTRWEYVDRDLDYRLGLWTQKPDGTQFQLFFGNTIREVGIFWQARAVPGHDDLVVATFAPPTGWPHGAIGLVTNRRGPEAPRDQGFAWLTDESLDVGDTTVHTDGMSYRDIEDGRLRDLAIHDGAFRPEGTPADLSLSYEMEARAGHWLDADRPAYRDPFPVSDYLFLVAYAAQSTQRFELYLLDLCGNRIPFYADPDMGTYHPLCLRPSSVFATSSVRDRVQDSDRPDSQWGRVLVTDVERGLPEAARGGRRYLQIMEQLPKTHQFARRAYDQSPVMGYGTYYAKRCWGRVPIESDGSAHFELPALREVYLQVLDAEGRELQRQTSSLQVMPGEVRSCIGCHEPRGMAPAASSRLPLAAQRPATRPVPPAWTDEGRMDFVAVVQPVLDRYCVQCHSGPDPDGGCDLSGDRTRLFSMAYDNLLGRSHSYRQHNLTTGEMLSQEACAGPTARAFLLAAPRAHGKKSSAGVGLVRQPDLRVLGAGPLRPGDRVGGSPACLHVDRRERPVLLRLRGEPTARARWTRLVCGSRDGTSCPLVRGTTSGGV